MTDAKLDQIASLLKHPFAVDSLRDLIAATAELSRVNTAYRWFFLLLNRCFVQLLDDPDPRDADAADVMMNEIRLAVLRGIAAIEKDDLADLLSAANYMSEVYCLL